VKKINVAYLIDTISCNTAGTQKQLLQTILRLDKTSFRPFLICLWGSPWMDNNEIPCETFVLGYTGFLKTRFPQVLKKLSRFLTERRIDIIQTFFEDSIFVAYLSCLLHRHKIPLLSSRRDMGLGNSQPWYHSLYGLVLPRVNRRFSGIIANCQKVKEFVVKREKVSHDKIKVIYNGIDIPARTSVKPEIFSRHKDVVWIGIVASLTPVKRIDVFLKALGILKKEYESINFQVIVLGDGPERENLLNLCKQLGIEGSVHFLGVVKNVIDYLKHIDIAVLCSDREGFSNAILEYMACSLPVVATAVGGNVELVDDTNGKCVQPGDYEKLACVIAELAVNEKLRKEKGQNSFQKVKNTYSWSMAMKEHENYYIDMLEDR